MLCHSSSASSHPPCSNSLPLPLHAPPPPVSSPPPSFSMAVWSISNVHLLNGFLPISCVFDLFPVSKFASVSICLYTIVGQVVPCNACDVVQVGNC
jgi:hypothetical protein